MRVRGKSKLQLSSLFSFKQCILSNNRNILAYVIAVPLLCCSQAGKDCQVHPLRCAAARHHPIPQLKDSYCHTSHLWLAFEHVMTPLAMPWPCSVALLAGLISQLVTDYLAWHCSVPAAHFHKARGMVMDRGCSWYHFLWKVEEKEEGVLWGEGGGGPHETKPSVRTRRLLFPKRSSWIEGKGHFLLSYTTTEARRSSSLREVTMHARFPSFECRVPRSIMLMKQYSQLYAWDNVKIARASNEMQLMLST